MNNQPTVSVITPVYNAEKYIKEAIMSVLSQSYDQLELIIIDDKSTDDSMSIVDSIHDSRIRIYENVINKGIAYSTNKAVTMASGKYIIFFDDDDIMPPCRIDKQVRFMECHQDIALLGGKSLIIDGKGCVISDGDIIWYDSERLHYKTLFQMPFSNGSAMVRNQVIKDNGLKIQDNCLGMQDFNFFIDVSKLSGIEALDEVTLLHRVHGCNESSKIFNKKGAERGSLFSALIKKSVIREGFILDEDELLLLTRAFPESSYCEMDEEEIIGIQNIFYKMLRQAKAFSKDDYWALKYVFSYKLSKLCERNWIENIELDVEDESIFHSKLLCNNDNKKKRFTVIFAGAGRYLMSKVDDKWMDYLDVIAIMDNNIDLLGKTRYGLPIISPDEVHKYSFDHIIIMIKNDEAFRIQLTNLGIPEYKICGYDEFVVKNFLTLSNI